MINKKIVQITSGIILLIIVLVLILIFIVPKDSDRDSLSDKKELKLGTDPTKIDSDGDGVTDSEELKQGSNPLNKLDYGLLWAANDWENRSSFEIKEDKIIVSAKGGGDDKWFDFSIPLGVNINDTPYFAVEYKVIENNNAKLIFNPAVVLGEVKDIEMNSSLGNHLFFTDLRELECKAVCNKDAITKLGFYIYAPTQESMKVEFGSFYTTNNLALTMKR